MKAISLLTSILGAAAFLASCSKDDVITTTTPPLQGDPFEIRAWDYSTNHFVVDTSYLQLYEPYYLNDPPVVFPATQIVEEEVWVQRVGAVPDPNERQARSFIALPPRYARGYDSTLLHTTENPGVCESGPFVRLNRSEYQMRADGYLGIISLRIQVEVYQVIAIAYQRADGIQYGEFARNVPDYYQPIILKMVKPKNLNSVGNIYPVAWGQLLKNVYSLGSHNVREVGFELKIFFGSRSSTQISNQPLLRVLGLDRFNLDGTTNPSGDGQFDFRPGLTIDQANGEIILPRLRPFDEGIRMYFTSRELALPDPIYYSPAIYDTSKVFAQTARGSNYSFSGRAMHY